MNARVENGTLIIDLVGQIDSGNAGEVEKEITAVREAHEHDALTLDFENLKYISSVGLRIILRLRKLEKNMEIVNVSSDVYEVLDMTGFTEIIAVKKAYRKLSVEGCEIIGRGANGTVYRIDKDTVVKVYKNADCLPDVQRERELARKAFILGIPTAIPYDVVKVGESYGSVFELLNSKSFSKLIAANPQTMDHYIELFADIMTKMHETPIKPGDMPEMKGIAVDWAKFVKDYLPAEQGEKLLRMVEEVPNRQTMMHGDYHTNNIVIQNDEVLLIDMDTLCVGHPVFELGSVYMAFIGFGRIEPEKAGQFLRMTYEMSKEFFDKTLARYLGTDDKAVIEDVKNKAKAVCYMRLLRRTVRRSGLETPQGREQIDICKQEIADALSKIDTLTF